MGRPWQAPFDQSLNGFDLLIGNGGAFASGAYQPEDAVYPQNP